MWSWQQEKKFIGRHMTARWHKTTAKLKGYKMTKKKNKWTTVKLSAMGILTKKPKKLDSCQALSHGYFSIFHILQFQYIDIDDDNN